MRNILKNLVFQCVVVSAAFHPAYAEEIEVNSNLTICQRLLAVADQIKEVIDFTASISQVPYERVEAKFFEALKMNEIRVETIESVAYVHSMVPRPANPQFKIVYEGSKEAVITVALLASPRRQMGEIMEEIDNALLAASISLGDANFKNSLAIMFSHELQDKKIRTGDIKSVTYTGLTSVSPTQLLFIVEFINGASVEIRLKATMYQAMRGERNLSE